VKAAEYFEQGADDGDRESQFKYAMCLRNGLGGEIDVKKSMFYLRLAASQEHVEAMFVHGLDLLKAYRSGDTTQSPFRG
jgi:TPR repeat protein